MLAMTSLHFPPASEAELGAIFRALEEPPHNVAKLRTRAILAVMADTGLGTTVIRRLRIEDADPAQGMVIHRGEHLWLTDENAARLADWLEVRTLREGYLFPSLGKGAPANADFNKQIPLSNFIAHLDAASYLAKLPRRLTLSHVFTRLVTRVVLEGHGPELLQKITGCKRTTADILWNRASAWLKGEKPRGCRYTSVAPKGALPERRQNASRDRRFKNSKPRGPVPGRVGVEEPGLVNPGETRVLLVAPERKAKESWVIQGAAGFWDGKVWGSRTMAKRYLRRRWDSLVSTGDNTAHWVA